MAAPDQDDIELREYTEEPSSHPPSRTPVLKLEAVELDVRVHPVRNKPKISLHKAAKDGRVNVVRVWMDVDNLEIDARDSKGYTAFHYAAEYNHLDIMRILTRREAPDLEELGVLQMVTADHTLRTRVDGLTALHLAAKYNQSSSSAGIPEGYNKETLKFLVYELKLDVNKMTKHGTFALHLACSRGNKAAVEVLFGRRDIKTDLRDADKSSILHEACTTDNVELLELLLEKLKEKRQLRAMLTSKNDSDHTPLHVAFSYGHPKIASKLLESAENGAYAKIDESNPPLLLACSQEKEKIVTEFLKLNLKLTVCQNDGATILHQVSERGWTAAAEVIIHKESSLLNKKDNCDQTPLHYAAANNRSHMIYLLMKENADVDALDRDERTPLSVAVSNGFSGAFAQLSEKVDMTRVGILKNAMFLAAEADQWRILVYASMRNPSLYSEVDGDGNTLLHAAAAHGSERTLQTLLKKQVRVNTCNVYKKTPLHLAAENGHNGIVKQLLEADDEGSSDEEGDTAEENAHTVDISVKDEDSNTALHLAARRGHYRVADLLLEEGADIRARNRVLWTPLDCAASEGHQELVELLIKKGAVVDSKDKSGETPLHQAAKRGHTKVVQTLLKHKADLSARNTKGANTLELAIENGHVDIVTTLLKRDEWRDAMRNTSQSREGQTTPMRRLIRKMPEVALEVFNRCTTTENSPDSKEYTVTFDYEFLEDFSADTTHHTAGLVEAGDSLVTSLHQHWRIYFRPSSLFNRVIQRFSKSKKKGHTYTPWGPAGFHKSNHPLKIMVKSKRNELLDHPLVSSLIQYKWSKASLFYLANFIFYGVLLDCLTAYALMLPNPQSELCRSVSNHTFGNASDTTECFNSSNSNSYQCGKCSSSQAIIYGVLVLLCVVFRVIMEFLQFLEQPGHYFCNSENWLELFLYSFTLLFMFSLGRTCVCPEPWQWQIGALAVFLAWIHLSLFIKKLPHFGLYIIMFEDIVKTFAKLAIPALLLVVAFSMAFYMMFFVPSPLFAASPFATLGLSIIKAMTMAVGEMEFETIFRLTSGSVGDIDDVPTPIPYSRVSILLWIFFLILMPILLMNLLTGLAVGDVEKIQSSAEYRKLALQIELVLKIEETFQVFRAWLVKGKDTIKPNKNLRYKKLVRSVLVGERVYLNLTAENISQSLSEPVKHIKIEHVHKQMLPEIRTEMAELKGELKAGLKMVHRKNRRMEILLKRMAEKLYVDTDLEEEDY